MANQRQSSLTLVALIALALHAAPAFAGGGSTGGGDKVEPLFIDAQKKAAQVVNAIDVAAIDQLKVPAFYRNWLKTDDRLAKLQYFVSTLEIAFQNSPCIEDGDTRGTCFDGSNPNRPIMRVSYSFNQNTTPQQAQVLVLHEAGHALGEGNHAFLSGLGLELITHPLKVFKPTGRVRALDGMTEGPDGSVYFAQPMFRLGSEQSYSYFLGVQASPEALRVTASGACRHLGFTSVVTFRYAMVPMGTNTLMVSIDEAGKVLSAQRRDSGYVLSSLTCMN